MTTEEDRADLGYLAAKAWTRYADARNGLYVAALTYVRAFDGLVINPGKPMPEIGPRYDAHQSALFGVAYASKRSMDTHKAYRNTRDRADDEFEAAENAA